MHHEPKGASSVIDLNLVILLLKAIPSLRLTSSEVSNFFSKSTVLMRTVQVSHPVSAARACAIAASISAVLTFFNEGCAMKISQEQIGSILHLFSLQFPLPFSNPAHQDDFLYSWNRLFRDCDETAFKDAARSLMLSLKRFPCPADFAEQMKKDAKPATPDAPQP